MPCPAQGAWQPGDCRAWLLARTAGPEHSQRLFQLLCKERQMQAARSLGPSCTTAEMPIFAVVQGHKRRSDQPYRQGSTIPAQNSYSYTPIPFSSPLPKMTAFFRPVRQLQSYCCARAPWLRVPGHPSNTAARGHTTLICGAVAARELRVLNLLVELCSKALTNGLCTLLHVPSGCCCRPFPNPQWVSQGA